MLKKYYQSANWLSSGINLFFALLSPSSYVSRFYDRNSSIFDREISFWGSQLARRTSVFRASELAYCYVPLALSIIPRET